MKIYDEEYEHPPEWIEDNINDMLSGYDDIRELFKLEKSFEFVIHDLRSFYWSEAENNQLACILNGRQSFWPIAQSVKLGYTTLVLFKGLPPSRVFVLSNNCKIPMERFRTI
jgi:hypothetical protein